MASTAKNAANALRSARRWALDARHVIRRGCEILDKKTEELDEKIGSIALKIEGLIKELDGE